MSVTPESMRPIGPSGGVRPPDSFAQRSPNGRSTGGSEEQLANVLGWVSLGLGIAGLAAPDAVARMIGVPDTDENRNVIRGIGVREIASGVGILSQPRPVEWVWSRVAGDVMDLALLGKAMTGGDTDRNRLTKTTMAVAGITGLDLLCSSQLSARTVGTMRDGQNAGQVMRAKSITVNCTPEQAYQFWRNFENLPRFMRHLESVQMLDERRSHWCASGPAGVKVEWDAEMVDDRPNELIAWRSLPGADVENSGVVRFQKAPGDRGTEVRVEMQYAPPGGMVGSRIAWLMGKEPGQQVAEDLRRFKQMMELGEVPVSDGSLAGPQFPQRPGQPPSASEMPMAA